MVREPQLRPHPRELIVCQLQPGADATNADDAVGPKQIQLSVTRREIQQISDTLQRWQLFDLRPEAAQELAPFCHLVRTRARITQ